jgi:hypothetical protein
MTALTSLTELCTLLVRSVCRKSQKISIRNGFIACREAQMDTFRALACLWWLLLPLSSTLWTFQRSILTATLQRVHHSMFNTSLQR